MRGIVDFLKKNNINVFGPSKFASQLEGSKAFMKKICAQNNIPTAKFKICTKIKDVDNFLKNSNFPVVVKADGLAAGKGVSICKTKSQVYKISASILMVSLNRQKNLFLKNI